MKIPKRVKILGQIYTVGYQSEMQDDMGECDYQNNTITLLSGMPEEKMMQTFLHEIVHAIDFTMNLNLKENQVDNMSVALYQILKENNIVVKPFQERKKTCSTKK